MSQGYPWVDEVMRPLGFDNITGIRLSTEVYNRIYEAVSRGNVMQGHALVAAIVHTVEQALKQCSTPTEGDKK